jgi:hypothetical protein
MSAISSAPSTTTGASSTTSSSTAGCWPIVGSWVKHCDAGTVKRTFTRHGPPVPSNSASATTGRPRGLRDRKARLLRPDAVLELPRRGGGSHTFLIEHDRTRRVDKNYDKFRRYDSFVCWWWRHHPAWAEHGDAPFVLFVCQDEDQRDVFMAAADRELSGHFWHPSVGADQHVYLGRRRVLFACEIDMHAGRLEAWRLPSFPPDHPRRGGREAEVHAVRLPGSPRALGYRQAPRAKGC